MRCRDDQRPAFVDLKTYRYLGHSMSDPQKYRTKEEVEQFKAKDSIDASPRSSWHLYRPRKSDAAASPRSPQDQFRRCSRSQGAGARRGRVRRELPDPRPSELYSDVLVNPQPNMSPTAEYTFGAKNPLL
jgi:pyruvate dehydrogenase E1 component alpha subunit